MSEQTFYCVQCGKDHPITHGHYANPLCHKEGYAFTQTENKQCPRCDEYTLSKDSARTALSHLDNKTELCSNCGRHEGLIGLGYETDPHQIELHNRFKEQLDKKNKR